MSEQNSTEMTFQIQRIYTKDISFEAPNAPQVFQKDWQPEVKLDLDTASTQLAEGALPRRILPEHSVPVRARVHHQPGFPRYLPAT